MAFRLGMADSRPIKNSFSFYPADMTALEERVDGLRQWVKAVLHRQDQAIADVEHRVSEAQEAAGDEVRRDERHGDLAERMEA